MPLRSQEELAKLWFEEFPAVAYQMVVQGRVTPEMKLVNVSSEIHTPSCKARCYGDVPSSLLASFKTS